MRRRDRGGSGPRVDWEEVGEVLREREVEEGVWAWAVGEECRPGEAREGAGLQEEGREGRYGERKDEGLFVVYKSAVRRYPPMAVTSCLWTFKSTWELCITIHTNWLKKGLHTQASLAPLGSAAFFNFHLRSLLVIQPFPLLAYTFTLTD